MRRTAVLGLLLLFLTTFPIDTLGAPEGWTKNHAFPDIAFHTSDGNKHKLSDYRGKVIFLNFWASWCGPCIKEWPTIEKSYHELKSQAEFLVLNMYEPYDVGVKWAQAKGYTMPLCDSGYAPRGSQLFKEALTHANGTFINYHKYFIPSSFVIDKNGVIVKVWRKSRIHGGAVRKAIEQAATR